MRLSQDIPTLEHGVPKGKSGKDHRILTNEIRENEQALLQMLVKFERKRVDKCRKVLNLN